MIISNCIIINGGMVGKTKLKQSVIEDLISITDYNKFMNESKMYRTDLKYVTIKINFKDSMDLNIAKHKGKMIRIEWIKRGMMYKGSIIIG